MSGATPTAPPSRGIFLSSRTARSRPIIGTTPDYFRQRGLAVRAGRLPILVGEAVLGATVARDLGLGPGDTLLSDYEKPYDISTTYPLKMHVSGVLAESGSPDDGAVFVDVKTAWVIEGIGHGHGIVHGIDAQGQLSAEAVGHGNGIGHQALGVRAWPQFLLDRQGCGQLHRPRRADLDRVDAKVARRAPAYRRSQVDLEGTVSSDGQPCPAIVNRCKVVDNEDLIQTIRAGVRFDVHGQVPKDTGSCHAVRVGLSVVRAG